MTPDQATFLMKEVFLTQIHQEHPLTRKIIEAIPADKLDYKPDPKSKSAMELAKHIAATEMFFMGAVANGEFNRADAAIPETVTTPAQLAAWFDESYAKATEKLAATSPEALLKVINFAIFSFPAITYIGLMNSHSIHHRGQLSTYLRPMGSKVPRIYGGSADEPIEIPAAKAQET
ncbi:MAG TPA: DinB family protein [Bryobacteraceae bacterium]|nr:DinB family protein [Bryobacteraceae bacterium]